MRVVWMRFPRHGWVQPPGVSLFSPQRRYMAVNELRSRGSRRDRRAGVGLPKGMPGLEKSPRQPPGIFEEESWWPDLVGTRRLDEQLREPFVVLGIETSCDDTAAAVVRSDGKILGEVVVSQAELHEEWGGVVPGVAREAHEQAIHKAIDDALGQAGCDIDAVGVTVGPGLEICLRVGFRAARDCAEARKVPFVAVNHLEGHALLAKQHVPELQFPFLVLLVSGGHCQLLECLGVGEYTLIGGTLDDALGEAYDKTARLLGLNVGGGGGPILEQLAKRGNRGTFQFPVPMRHRKDCNLSYAGLKTSVRTAIDKVTATSETEDIDEQTKADIAVAFQDAALTHLIERTRRAMERSEKDEDKPRRLVVAGGVAANAELRSRLDELVESRGWELFVPPARLCTDNGVMVAWAAVERLKMGIADNHRGLAVRARWPLGSLEVSKRV